MVFSHEVRDRWSASSKLIFRGVFVYCIGYILFMFTATLLAPILKWIGKTIGSTGRLEIFQTGSGDTTMAYMALILLIFTTVVCTLLWTILDRKRPSYNQLFYWFTVILRIFLIFFMFTYGFVKIFKVQFGGPSLTDLLQPLGDMSPMGLAWTYMGHSEGFNMFVGIMEVLGGLLLIPRRTQTLGAFITIGVMTQVAMMNFFYDIPVKLFSVHLILMALVIFIADWKRFSQVFLKNETAVKLDYFKVTTDKVYDTIIFWFKIIASATLISLMSWQGYTRENEYGDKREKPELYGIWEATTFVQNGKELPALITDSLRWRYLIIDRKDQARVKTMTDELKTYTFKIDAKTTKVTMYEGDWEQSENLLIKRDSTALRLQGVLYGDTLDIQFKVMDLSKIPLINRGFHWVNETPYNR